MWAYLLTCPLAIEIFFLKKDRLPGFTNALYCSKLFVSFWIYMLHYFLCTYFSCTKENFISNFFCSIAMNLGGRNCNLMSKFVKLTNLILARITLCFSLQKLHLKCWFIIWLSPTLKILYVKKQLYLFIVA